MNKRILITIVILIILAIFAYKFMKTPEAPNPPQPSTSTNNNEEKIVEVTDLEKIEKIKTDSYLNTLLQIKTFDSLNISYEPLLEAAMRLANELDLYQIPDDGAYVEYVPRTTVHQIIFELTGIKIEKPIIVEDFYYLYDSTGDYYYVVPIGSDWLELGHINSIHYTSNSDQYIIKCSATNLSDYAIETTYPEVEVRLKYKPSNTYIKYQLISINSGKPIIDVLSPSTYDYSGDI